ncbi:nuclear transport factor 2 family protein [Myxococcota bacterium]|nr:nuclear transport factor 2 family protein [Myxococcota bacterium]
MLDEQVRRLGDEQAIRDALARYWRGIDRQDPSWVSEAYHSDAYDDHGYYKGPVSGFIESLQPGVWAYFKNTQHFSGHTSVTFRGPDTAHAESYSDAHHIRHLEDGTLEDLVYGLRYVDLFERRDDEWRIAHRVCTWDWHRIDRVGGIQLPDTYFRGHHSREDPVFSHPRSPNRRVEAGELEAKLACYDVLMRYARGVDRCDPELVRSTYHADAYDDHGGYQGDADGFVNWVKPTVMDTFTTTMHKLGNALIEVRGDQAFAETYAVAHHVLANIDTPSDLIMGVRYIDRLEQRGGQWKIAHRQMSFEWERSVEIGSQGRLAPYPRGLRDGNDPVLSQSTHLPASGPHTRDPAAARSEIHAVLMRYCRGIDRRDTELIRSAFHPDATQNLGVFQGGVEELLDYLETHVYPSLRTTVHKLGQVLIEIDEDMARCESYAITHAIRAEESGDSFATVTGCRYLDRFERREGSWRIVERELRYEWTRTDSLQPLDSTWTHGVSGPTDPVFD